MSTTKPYFPAHSSVLQYLNYIRLRLRDGFAIDNDEENNTYEYYVQFCEDNDLEFYAYNMFYRELKKYGFDSRQRHNRKDRTKKVSRRDFSVENVERLLESWDNTNNARFSTILKMNGEEYQMIIKLIKISSTNVDSKTTLGTPSSIEVDDVEVDTERDGNK